MNFFLLKTEPSDCGIYTIEKKGVVCWDGVKNALAIKYLKTITLGDFCFIYHTGKEKQIVGLCQATSHAYERANETVIDLKFVKTFSTCLTLAQIKQTASLASFELIRLPRLSVMPVPSHIAEFILNYTGTSL